MGLLSAKERFAIHLDLAEQATTDGERARHYLHGGDPDRARSYALRAAQQASSRNERADHLAIGAIPVDGERDPELLLDAAEALALAGRVEDGLAFAVVVRSSDRVCELRKQNDRRLVCVVGRALRPRVARARIRDARFSPRTTSRSR